MDHNYKKRDYLLPEGCKDLIDVWKPKAKPVQYRPAPLRPLPSIIGELAVPDRMKVGDLAAVLKKKPFQIIADLMEIGLFVNVKQRVDFESISKVVRKYGYTAKRVA
jgi:translation initiation factor IF-2